MSLDFIVAPAAYAAGGGRASGIPGVCLRRQPGPSERASRPTSARQLTSTMTGFAMVCVSPECACCATRQRSSMIDVEKQVITDSNVNLEKLARKLSVLRLWERMAKP